jgi:hypothetical protein
MRVFLAVHVAVFDLPQFFNNLIIFSIVGKKYSAASVMILYTKSLLLKKRLKKYMINILMQELK